MPSDGIGNSPGILYAIFCGWMINGGAAANMGIIRYRPKGVFGKGVGNSQKCVKNASEMRQKCVRNASKWVLFYWEKRNVQNASEMRQNSVKKSVKNARNTFGGEHLLDDTESCKEVFSF